MKEFKTILKSVQIVIVFVSLIASSTAFAQSLEEQRLKSGTKYNVLNDVTIDTNAQKDSTVDHDSGMTYTAGLRYSLDKKSSFWGFLRFSKRFSGEERFDFLDTILRYERRIGSYKGFSNRMRFSAILPTNEFIHEQTSFLGGVSGQLRSGRSLNSKLYLNLINTLRWNYHTYRVSELAFPNVQATFRAMANLSYTMTNKILISSALGWAVGKTYKDTFKDSYSIDLSGTYSLTPKWSVSLGFTTAGAPVKADNRSSNINLFDERDTTYYFNVSHFQ